MAEVKTYVAGGHVFCPVHRDDRDVLQCIDCGRLHRVNERSSPPHIVCDLDEAPGDGTTDPQFVEWWHQHHRRGAARGA